MIDWLSRVLETDPSRPFFVHPLTGLYSPAPPCCWLLAGLVSYLGWPAFLLLSSWAGRQQRHLHLLYICWPSFIYITGGMGPCSYYLYMLTFAANSNHWIGIQPPRFIYCSWLRSHRPRLPLLLLCLDKNKMVSFTLSFSGWLLWRRIMANNPSTPSSPMFTEKTQCRRREGGKSNQVSNGGPAVHRPNSISRPTDRPRTRQQREINIAIQKPHNLQQYNVIDS